jgi:hypothetical protein
MVGAMQYANVNSEGRPTIVDSGTRSPALIKRPPNQTSRHGRRHQHISIGFAEIASGPHNSTFQ